MPTRGSCKLVQHIIIFMVNKNGYKILRRRSVIVFRNYLQRDGRAHPWCMLKLMIEFIQWNSWRYLGVLIAKRYGLDCLLYRFFWGLLWLKTRRRMENYHDISTMGARFETVYQMWWIDRQINEEQFDLHKLSIVYIQTSVLFYVFATNVRK